MSNDDFEVLPRGTTTELQFLRQLAKDVLECYPVNGVHWNKADIAADEVKRLAAKVREFYYHHNEKYPVSS